MNADLNSFKTVKAIFTKLSHPAEAWEVNLIHHDIHKEQEVIDLSGIGSSELQGLSQYGPAKILGSITFTCKHEERGPALV